MLCQQGKVGRPGNQLYLPYPDIPFDQSGFDRETGAAHGWFSVQAPCDWITYSKKKEMRMRFGQSRNTSQVPSAASNLNKAFTLP